MSAIYKDGGIVLMNVEFYKNKILEMLNNEFYSSIPNSNKKEIFARLKELINQNENITDHADFLLNFDCKQSTFYGLPKIHKR